MNIGDLEASEAVAMSLTGLSLMSIGGAQICPFSVYLSAGLGTGLSHLPGCWGTSAQGAASHFMVPYSSTPAHGIMGAQEGALGPQSPV